MVLPVSYTHLDVYKRQACGRYGNLVLAYRSLILSFCSPSTAIPDKSPLISITKVGIPLCESCSTKTCRVLVLPVPVAPAIKPVSYTHLDVYKRQSISFGLILL